MKLVQALGTFSVYIAAAALPIVGHSNEYASQIQRFVDSKLKTWMADPAVVEAIKLQNEQHKGLDEAGILELDQTWRSQADGGGGPLIADLLGRAISERLKANKSELPELITEIFVMDNLGLNVGQSDITSDYWQGDEAKWQKTYQAGPEQLFMDEVEFDDSTELFQTQVSMSISDPADGSVIGAVTVGLNVEALE